MNSTDWRRTWDCCGIDVASVCPPDRFGPKSGCGYSLPVLYSLTKSFDLKLECGIIARPASLRVVGEEIEVTIVVDRSTVTDRLDSEYLEALEEWHASSSAAEPPSMPGLILRSLSVQLRDDQDIDRRLISRQTAGDGTEWTMVCYFSNGTRGPKRYVLRVGDERSRLFEANFSRSPTVRPGSWT